MKTASLSALAIMLAVLGLVMFLAVKYIVGDPLARFVAALRVCQGDLTRRVEVHSQDEIGEIAWLFNEFIGELNKGFSQAKSAASASNEQAKGVEQISTAMMNIDKSTRGAVDKVAQLEQTMKVFKT